MIAKKDFQLILGGCVRKIRVSKKISVEELAHESGLTYSQISRIELGKINPTSYTLFKMSEALGVSVNEIYNNVQVEISKSK